MHAYEEVIYLIIFNSFLNETKIYFLKLILFASFYGAPFITTKFIVTVCNVVFGRNPKAQLTLNHRSGWICNCIRYTFNKTNTHKNVMPRVHARARTNTSKASTSFLGVQVRAFAQSFYDVFPIIF